jgi:hypothetical protein
MKSASQQLSGNLVTDDPPSITVTFWAPLLCTRSVISRNRGGLASVL